MAKTFRTTDRKTIQIGDISIEIAPLTLFQKQLLLQGGNPENFADLVKYNFNIIAHSVKKVTGIEYCGNEKYVVEFDDKGAMTNNSLEELLNVECGELIQFAIQSLSSNWHLEKFIDQTTKKEMKGIKLVGVAPKRKAPKKTKKK